MGMRKKSLMKFEDVTLALDNEKILSSGDLIRNIFSFRQKNEEEPAAENVDDNQNSLTELDVAEKECCKINF